MRYYIAQLQQQKETPPPIYAKSTVITMEIIISLLAGGLGALGLPKLLQAFASEKIENVKSERRREDTVYSTLFQSMESMMKSMTQMNNTMAAGQSSAASESFQLMATLVQEISLIRDVVSNNTIVMEQVRDTNEALTHEIYEIRVAGIELRGEVENIKKEVLQITRQT